MPELRKDPIIGRWVIISTERGKRPHDFVVEPEVTKGGFCPFDPGNEHTTPPEVLAYREPGTTPNTPGWQLRVVNNKFPALAMEGQLDRQGEGMFDKMNGIGAHEVIIESPDHQATLATIPVDGFVRVLIGLPGPHRGPQPRTPGSNTSWSSKTRAGPPGLPWSTATASSSACPSCRSWCRRN